MGAARRARAVRGHPSQTRRRRRRARKGEGARSSDGRDGLRGRPRLRSFPTFRHTPVKLAKVGTAVRATALINYLIGRIGRETDDRAPDRITFRAGIRVLNIFNNVL